MIERTIYTYMVLIVWVDGKRMCLFLFTNTFVFTYYLVYMHVVCMLDEQILTIKLPK